MRRLLIASAVLVLATSWSHAQSTAFTYQGELKANGTPTSGLHDFRFRLFDASSGGSAVGSQLCVDNVAVTDGKFTTAIDFGQAFATTAGRFLEIEVRRDTGLNCGSAAGFVILTPRQAITATPRALAAATATSLTIPNGTSSLVNLTNGGNVGIGTFAPTSQLELAGVQDALRLNAYQPTITFQDTSSGNNRSVVQGVNGGVFNIGGQFLNGTNGSAFTFMTSAGDVALGHYTPQAKLDVSGSAIVRGDFRFGPAAQYRPAASEENLRIVRGTVDTHQSDGCNAVPTIATGGGFTVDRQGCGQYRITFATPFTGLPTVTATGILGGGCAPIVTVTTISSGGFTVYVSCDTSSVGSALWSYSIIAIGPR